MKVILATWQLGEAKEKLKRQKFPFLLIATKNNKQLRSARNLPDSPVLLKILSIISGGASVANYKQNFIQRARPSN